MPCWGKWENVGMPFNWKFHTYTSAQGAVHMAAACPASANQDCFKASQSSCHAMGTAPRDDKVRNGPASADQDCSKASQSSCHVHMEAAGPTSTDQDCSGWTSSCHAQLLMCCVPRTWKLLWLALEQSWSALPGPAAVTYGSCFGGH